MLSAELVGRRIVLRYRREDGILPPLSDVVGELASLTSTTAIVTGPNGPITINRAAIVAVRTVAPHRRQILELERVARRGWRAAEVVELDGWLLHADQGWTGRANSVLPLVTPRRPLSDLLAAAGRFYSERGLPVWIQAPLPARGLLDAELAGRCWSVQRPAVVLSAPISGSPEVGGSQVLGSQVLGSQVLGSQVLGSQVLGSQVLGSQVLGSQVLGSDEQVRLDPVASADWLDGYHYRGGPLPEHAVRLLNRHDQVRFASLSRDGSVVGVARGAVDDGWLGVTAVEVAPGHRRSGVASSLMRALAGWGRSRGATRCYLQVDIDNSGALEFYRQLGFIAHHRYHYRAAPAAN